ncbi:type III pantothenate kinase [bacterium]|nr:type III pantothenate kinase [bacterium]
MLLAIDIGNTHTVMGLFKDDELAANWRASTIPTRTGDEWFTQVMALSRLADFKFNEIKYTAISSVVPEVTLAILRMSSERLHIEPFMVESDADYGIKNAYDNPRAVGPDRICNAVAGYTLFGGPLIIVDFGTATTFDVISSDGVYLGGVIAPGLETSSKELHRRAAKLTRVDLHFPDKIIGRNTETSVQAGIMFGALESVDGIVKRIWDELGGRCKVIATGGLAGLIAPKSSVIESVQPFLVLIGLNIIFNRVKK